MQGTYMLQALVDSAVQWTADNQVDLSSDEKDKSNQASTQCKADKQMDLSTTEKEKSPKGKHTKSKKGTKGHSRRRKGHSEDENEKSTSVSGKFSDESEEMYEKKASMKTSEDVISRIMWDEALPTEHFVVGYLDRFIGIVEKNITAFSWEDLASVDWNTLAIPKHRIQYFKYKTVKFWDKSLRLDNMFGSVGSGVTITDVIMSYEAERGEQEQAEAANDNLREDSDDNSDDDFDIRVGHQVDTEDEIDEAENNSAPYWGVKVRPTHFLALRVTNPDVMTTIKDAQEKILAIEPTYEQCVIPTERLHITLCCLGLDTPDQVKDAVNVLNKVKQELQDNWNPSEMVLKLQDTDHFFHSTLYAKVHCEQVFINFVHHLKTCMCEAGIGIRDVFEFIPHVTIMKLARQMAYETRNPYIDTRLYDALHGQYFGSFTVDNVYLCEMSEERDTDGFYSSHAKITFD